MRLSVEISVFFNLLSSGFKFRGFTEFDGYSDRVGGDIS